MWSASCVRSGNNFDHRKPAPAVAWLRHYPLICTEDDLLDNVLDLHAAPPGLDLQPIECVGVQIVNRHGNWHESPFFQLFHCAVEGILPSSNMCGVL